MNENIDLIKILMNCPTGIKLNSQLYGDVEFVGTTESVDPIYKRIKVKLCDKSVTYYNRFGIPFGILHGNIARCDLFPSEIQRDWSKFEVPIKRFDPKDLKPFDKVLVRFHNNSLWRIDLFSSIRSDNVAVTLLNASWDQCIPYNDDTKHLLGTYDSCPDYYKWWLDVKQRPSLGVAD